MTTETEMALNYYKAGALQGSLKPWARPRYIPKSIRLIKDVRGDGHYKTTLVLKGEQFVAECNPYGAVSVNTMNGKLGLRLDEFEVLEWRENEEWHE